MLEDLGVYKHASEPYAFLAFSSASQSLALALSIELLSSDFRLIIVSLDKADLKLRDSLLDGRPEADSDVQFFTLYEDVETGLQELSKSLQTKNLTLSISCVDSSWWHNSEVCRIEKQRLLYGPHNIFIDLQGIILPRLVKNSPAALVVVSDTCLSALGPHEEALAKFLGKFTSGLMHEVKALGHEDVRITHMDYYQKRGPNNSTTPDETRTVEAGESVLSRAILQASTRSSLHMSPVWSHATLAWIVWLLLWFLPQSLLRKLF